MRLEPRHRPSKLFGVLSPVLAAVLTLCTGYLLFSTLGTPPLETLYSFFIFPIQDWYGISELLLKSVPLLLCALGLSLCFKAKVWNIGAEGQFLMGALAGGAMALQLNESTGFWVLPIVILAGIVGGMGWAAIASVLRTHFRCNEILTTIMLNYIALNLLLWAVHGPLKDPNGFNFPESALFSQAVSLPVLHDYYRTNISLYFALGLLILVQLMMSRTQLGYRIRVFGEDQRAASFAGYGTTALVTFVLLCSGAMAGLAGVSEVSGPVGQLIPHLSVGYGYAAIIVVFLGRMNPFGMLLASLLIGLTYMGGESIQMDYNLPKAVTQLFQGMLLFFLLITDLLINYRIRFDAFASKSKAIEVTS